MTTEHVRHASEHLAQAMTEANAASNHADHASRELESANHEHFETTRNLQRVQRMFEASIEHFAGGGSGSFGEPHPRFTPDCPFAHLLGQKPAEILVVLGELEVKAQAARERLKRAEDATAAETQRLQVCSIALRAARLSLRNAVRVECALPPVEPDPEPVATTTPPPATLNDVVTMPKSIEQRFQLTDCTEGK